MTSSFNCVVPVAEADGGNPGTALRDLYEKAGPPLHRGARPIAKARLWRRAATKSSLHGPVARPYAHAMADVHDPDECTTMVEVRAGVDALDAELVALLARRFGYMRAAARIKPHRHMVRDEARKAAVIANATAHAERLGLPAPVIEQLWENLVEASIGYELETFDQR